MRDCRLGVEFLLKSSDEVSKSGICQVSVVSVKTFDCVIWTHECVFELYIDLP